MCTIIPLGKRVLVEMVKPKEQIKGGIIIAAKNDAFNERCVVMSVGNDVMALEKGDVVLINKFKGQLFSIDDQEFIMLNEEDILARIID